VHLVERADEYDWVGTVSCCAGGDAEQESIGFHIGGDAPRLHLLQDRPAVRHVCAAVQCAACHHTQFFLKHGAQRIATHIRQFVEVPEPKLFLVLHHVHPQRLLPIHAAAPRRALETPLVRRMRRGIHSVEPRKERVAIAKFRFAGDSSRGDTCHEHRPHPRFQLQLSLPDRVKYSRQRRHV